MNTVPNKPSHPIMLAAGAAVILFCMAGTAAIMGWIPTSIGGNTSADEMSEASKVTLTPDPVRQSAAKPAVKAPVSRAPMVQADARPAVRCADCGVVESIREIEVRGDSNGVGVVGGAVVGGLLGNQVGGGRGKDAMTVVGAIGGAMAGNQIEKNIRKATSYEITVRLDNGSRRSITQKNAPAWRNGDAVRVVDGTLQPA